LEGKINRISQREDSLERRKIALSLEQRRGILIGWNEKKQWKFEEELGAFIDPKEGLTRGKTRKSIFGENSGKAILAEKRKKKDIVIQSQREFLPRKEELGTVLESLAIPAQRERWATEKNLSHY